MFPVTPDLIGNIHFVGYLLYVFHEMPVEVQGFEKSDTFMEKKPGKDMRFIMNIFVGIPSNPVVYLLQL